VIATDKRRSPPAATTNDTNHATTAAALTNGERTGAMATDVVKRSQPPVITAHQNQGDRADNGYDVIARLGEILRTGNELPAAREDRLLIPRCRDRPDIGISGPGGGPGEWLRA